MKNIKRIFNSNQLHSAYNCTIDEWNEIFEDYEKQMKKGKMSFEKAHELMGRTLDVISAFYNELISARILLEKYEEKESD